MPKLTDLQDADRQYDPYSNENARDLIAQENEAGVNAGIDQTEAYANDPKNSSSNIDTARQAEEEAGAVNNQFGWNDSKEGGNTNSSSRVRLKNFVKKRGALLGIGGGFIGVSSLFLMFLSPSLLLIHMSEVLTSKFNDQLAVLDTRQTLILKKKLNTTTTKGICGAKLTIKCKYRTISKNQSKRLKAAGITPLNDKGEIGGRGKPKAFLFEGREIKAGDLLSEARKSPALRSAIRKGYNPAFAAWADANAFKMLNRFGIKKSSSVDISSDKEKMRKHLASVAKGDVEDIGTTKLKGYKDGKEVPDAEADYFESEDGTRYDDPAEGRRINTLIQESIDRGGLADSIGKTALKNGVKSVLTSTAMGAGAVDSLCTAWTLVRVAGFAAKVYQQRQLIRYAYEFQKQADMIKAGDGKAELSTFFNDILTTTNANGKAATDSLGYMWAAYGDTFRPNNLKINKAVYSDKEAEVLAKDIEIQNETSRYVNGQLISTSLMAQLANKVSEGGKGVDAADSTCKFVKSWKGQALIISAALAGAVVAFFTGGASLTLGTVLNGAAGITVSVIFALLQPKLIDMAKGEVITGDENGPEAANGWVSGKGAINAQASQTRGLAVQSKDDYVEYSRLSNQVAADYAEVDRYERSPLDPTSKNTFVGSIVAATIPYVAKSQTVGSSVLSLASFINNTAASVLSPKTGAEPMTKEEVSQCDDYEYNKWDLAADPFCNLRYGMKKSDLAIDPEKVVDDMLAMGQINSKEDPTPKPGSDYEDYVKKCIDRETSIGDSLTNLSGTGDTGGYDGEMCVDGKGDAKRNTTFRLMHIDTSVDEGMETDYSIPGETAATGEASEFTFATYNILHSVYHADDSRRIGGCNANPVPGDPDCAKTRTARQVQIINGGVDNPAFDIVATQETSPEQYQLLKDSLPGYDVFPNNPSRLSNREDGAVAIYWNQAKFTKFDEGKMDSISNTSLPITNPWVGLQTTGGQKVYVTSIHYATNGFGGDAESIKKSSELTTNWVKEKVADGSTVIVGGDFNDRPSEKLSYCVYTKNDLMAHAQNIKNGVLSDPSCNKLPDFNGIDHIYATPNTGVTVTAWKGMAKQGIVTQASDHAPSYATFKFPGADGGDGGDVGGSTSGDDYGAACASGNALRAKCDGQCVDFVKYRLVKHGVIPKPPMSLGNGKDVVGTLKGEGFETGTVARVNSVFSTAQTSQSQYGHTGMVSEVKPDGSIIIEEYNFNFVPKTYGTRTMTKAEYQAKGYTFAYVGGSYK